MEAVPELVISREDNPPTWAYITKPFHILCGLAEVIIVYLDLRPCLSEGLRDHVLADAAVKEKDQGVYAAWRLSSHRIASSISRGGHS
jgi:hypothetical protein